MIFPDNFETSGWISPDDEIFVDDSLWHDKQIYKKGYISLLVRSNKIIAAGLPLVLEKKDSFLEDLVLEFDSIKGLEYTLEILTIGEKCY